MAHNEQRDYCEWVKRRYPDYFHGSRVLDIGSLDINGSNKYLFGVPDNVAWAPGAWDVNALSCEYIGLDLGAGENVDVISKAHEYDALDGSFDVIISTEMLEHDMYWRETLANALRMLRSGGLMILTCASGAREEHGTPKSGKLDASPFTLQIPEWRDYYCNLDDVDLIRVLEPKQNFTVCEIMQAGWAHKADGLFYDLYFSGVKK